MKLLWDFQDPVSQEEHPWGLDTTVNAVSHFHDPTLISVLKEVLGRGGHCQLHRKASGAQ